MDIESELMPLFMVKKEFFEWIRNGQKTIELMNWNREGKFYIKTDVSSKILLALL